MNPDRSRCSRITFLAFIVLAQAASAGSFLDGFRDSTDGKFDMSHWLVTRKGALPIATIVTEPTVGYGAGLGLVFFHQSIEERTKENEEKGGKKKPPSISAVFGMATENGTKFGAGGHFGSWKDDRYRYRGGAAYFAPKLDYYGNGGTANPISYKLEGWAIVQELNARIGASNIFAGARLVYGEVEGTLDVDDPELPRRDSEVTLGGLSGTLNWDTRDNILTPTLGVNMVLRATTFDDAIGSDRDFELYDSYAHVYLKPNERLVTGFRIDARASDGDTPFYLKPSLEMRGLPALRYADDVTALVEAEVRWNVRGRWSLVGFAGTGRVGETFGDLDEADSINAYGTGFRYLIARELGLHAGIDIGFGPDDTAWYIQIGNAWR